MQTKKIANKLKHFWLAIWGHLKIYLPIVIFLWAVGKYGSQGFWAMLIIYLVLAAILIAFNYKTWLYGKHMFETALWGKPLKDHTPKELRRKKLKFVWKKKRRTDHEQNKRVKEET